LADFGRISCSGEGYVIPTIIAVLPPGDATAGARADFEKVVFGLREKFAFGVRPHDPPSLSIEICCA